MADLQNIHPQSSQSSSCLSTPSCLPCKQEEPGLRAGNAQGQPQSSAVHLEHGLELSANKQTLNTLLCAEASANPPLWKGQSGWLIGHPSWTEKKCACVLLHPPRARGIFCASQVPWDILIAAVDAKSPANNRSWEKRSKDREQKDEAVDMGLMSFRSLHSSSTCETKRISAGPPWQKGWVFLHLSTAHLTWEGTKTTHQEKVQLWRPWSHCWHTAQQPGSAPQSPWRWLPGSQQQRQPEVPPRWPGPRGQKTAGEQSATSAPRQSWLHVTAAFLHS